MEAQENSGIGEYDQNVFVLLAGVLPFGYADNEVLFYRNPINSQNFLFYVYLPTKI